MLIPVQGIPDCIEFLCVPGTRGLSVCWLDGDGIFGVGRGLWPQLINIKKLKNQDQKKYWNVRKWKRMESEEITSQELRNMYSSQILLP